MNKHLILESLKEEMQKLSQAELTNFIAEKFSELYSLEADLVNKLDKLNKAVENSNLFFNLPEIELISSSKLPRVIIDAADPVGLDANLYPAEAHANGSFRWFGPNRLTKFFAPISREIERTFILRLFSQVTEGMYGSIRIYIDGDLADHDIEIKGGSAEVFITLPISNRVQDTVIGIFSPKLFKPSELNIEFTDDRLLGVAFTQIEVL